VVAAGAHGLPGAVDQEVVDQMTPAEGWEPVAVQKPVQPVPGKFRDNDGIHQRGNDSNEGDVQALVQHGSFSLLLAAAPETKQDSAAELTLQTVEAVFKRQGTPSNSGGEMSHHVVERDSQKVENKGLAAEGKRPMAHTGEGFPAEPLMSSRQKQ